MRANTITSMSRRNRQRRRRAVALAAGICALVIPSTATAGVAGPTTIEDSPPNAPSVGSADSSQATGGSDYPSVNSIVGSAESQPVGASGSSVGTDYASLNSITGPPADTPTFVSSSPSSLDAGFDWTSALMGAGAALALAALAGAALLTARRRSTVTPSPLAS
jgi:hypothetical protein